MKINLGELGTLTIPNGEGDRSRITSDCPQFHFIRSHQSDIQKEMGALKAILSTVSPVTFECIADLMAGCGFSGRVFQHRWPGIKLLLNDLSLSCSEILRRNFPHHQVENLPADKVELGPFYPDLVFVDFNNFTLSRMAEWERVFRNALSTRPWRFLFTDSHSYSFKFQQNPKPKEYYNKLNGEISRFGYYIHSVCIFGNAALILCGKNRAEIEYVESSPIRYQIQNPWMLL